MFVQELIAKLQDFDPNMVVVVDGLTQTVDSIEQMDINGNSVVCLNVVSVVDYTDDED